MPSEPRVGFVRVERAKPVEPEPDPTPPDDGPTLEQCERVWVLMGLPLLPEALRPPYWEKSVRNFHRIVQLAALGDEKAKSTLARLRAFAGVTDSVD